MVSIKIIFVAVSMTICIVNAIPHTKPSSPMPQRSLIVDEPKPYPYEVAKQIAKQYRSPKLEDILDQYLTGLCDLPKTELATAHRELFAEILTYVPKLKAAIIEGQTSYADAYKAFMKKHNIEKSPNDYIKLGLVDEYMAAVKKPDVLLYNSMHAKEEGWEMVLRLRIVYNHLTKKPTPCDEVINAYIDIIRTHFEAMKEYLVKMHIPLDD